VDLEAVRKEPKEEDLTKISFARFVFDGVNTNVLSQESKSVERAAGDGAARAGADASADAARADRLVSEAGGAARLAESLPARLGSEDEKAEAEEEGEEEGEEAARRRHEQLRRATRRALSSSAPAPAGVERDKETVMRLQELARQCIAQARPRPAPRAPAVGARGGGCARRRLKARRGVGGTGRA